MLLRPVEVNLVSGRKWRHDLIQNFSKKRTFAGIYSYVIKLFLRLLTVDLFLIMKESVAENMSTLRVIYAQVITRFIILKYFMHL